MEAQLSDADDLLTALRACAGEAAVRTDEAARALAASDVHVTGHLPLAVVRPTTAENLARAIHAATSRGYAVIARGGGLSYTGGYAPPHERCVTIDTSALNRIVTVADEDLYVSAQAGVTWKQLYDVLQSRGLRLPFFGTFSGAGATIGGGLSHGALFLGSARHGGAADIALGLEVALADGTLLRTGQGALKRPSKPVWRGFGPDLTGLFLHDGGAFGIKTEATLRLIRTPAVEDYRSFALPTLAAAADALSAVAREGLAEEAYVLEGEAASGNAARSGTKLRAALATLRAARSPSAAVAALSALAGGMPQGTWLLHIVLSGRSRAAVAADADALSALLRPIGAKPVGGLVPRAVRAEPFPGLDAIVDPDGSRWAALNAKAAHSDRQVLIGGGEAILARRRDDMAAAGVRATRLFSALGRNVFSYEVVFHWKDQWLPIHRASLSSHARRAIAEPPPAEAAHALVDELRAEFVEHFGTMGLASNQIGRTYPFRSALSDGPGGLIDAIKAAVDPQSAMNPCVLGLGVRPPRFHA